MSSVTAALPVLKGETFAQRLAEICAGTCPPQPIAGAKHQRILMPGIVGGELHYALLGLLAQGLRLRGATVDLLVCDAMLPACTSRRAEHHDLACTRWCHKNQAPFSAALGLPLRWYSEFITPEEKARCEREAAALSTQDVWRVVYRDIDLGPLIEHSIRAYFKIGGYDPAEPRLVEQARRFAAAGMCLVHIGERAIDALRPDKLVFEDGKKIDWGVIRAVARRRGVPSDVFAASPRSGCYAMEHDVGDGPSDLMPLWPQWRDLPLTAAQQARLDAYFASRATRPYSDQPWTDITPRDSRAEVRRAIGLPLDADGLTFAMFPNLGYDAGITSSSPIYPTCTQWVAETIRYFADKPAHHLVIKVHPSEKLRAAQDQMVDFVAREFPRLPDNVHVVPPDTTLTAHDVLNVLDVALVYSSTIGIEAAYFGKPVLHVGGSRHGGKGLYRDIHTPAAYFAALEEICIQRKLPPTDRDLACRYAYALFFRSVVPIRHYAGRYPRLTALNLDSLADLLPGGDPAMDVLCNGILTDAPFTGDDERLWR